MSDREAASCTGKTKYTSPNEAHNQLAYRKRHRKNLRKNSGMLHVYKCRFCKFWHIGRIHI